MTSQTPTTGGATDAAAVPGGLTRRRALCGLLVALAAPGALAACATAGGGPAPMPPGGTPVSQIPVGSGTLVLGPNGPVLLEQPTTGVIKAYDATCPHQGVTVDPPVNGTITCPGHGSQFDAATGALKLGPATTGLTPVSTRVVNGAVQFA